MWARAALASLALFGSCADAIPIIGFGHLGNLSYPSARGNALCGCQGQAHGPNKICLSKPILTENVSKSIFYLHSNYGNYGSWRDELCPHFGNKCGLRRCIAVRGNIIADSIEPIWIEDAFDVFVGVLKGYVPEKIPGWGLATIGCDEPHAGRRDPKHDKINAGIFNVNVSSNLGLADTTRFSNGRFGSLNGLTQAPGLPASDKHKGQGENRDSASKGGIWWAASPTRKTDPTRQRSA